MALGQHIRLSPAHKEVFFQSDFSEGVGQASQLPIAFHSILGSEWISVGGAPRINFNSTNSGFGGVIPNHFPQRMMRILDMAASGMTANFGVTAFSGTPTVLANLVDIKIYTGSIRGLSPNNLSSSVPEPERDIPMLLTTLAHEVGHAVGFEDVEDPADTCPATPEHWTHMIINYFTLPENPTEWLCRWSSFPGSYRPAELQSLRLR